MRMVKWNCDVKVKDKIPCKGLRNRLGLDDIILEPQQNRSQISKNSQMSDKLELDIHLFIYKQNDEGPNGH